MHGETLLWGTVNPTGKSSEDYHGLFLTERDIEYVSENNILNGLPLLVEHCGDPIGSIVSCWKAKDGKLDVLASINRDSMEGSIATNFLKNNQVLNDFSLGYSVSIQYSDSKHCYVPDNKRYNEVSLVRKGAQPDCHIHAYSVEEDKDMEKRVKELMDRAVNNAAWATLLGE